MKITINILNRDEEDAVDTENERMKNHEKFKKIIMTLIVTGQRRGGCSKSRKLFKKS